MNSLVLPTPEVHGGSNQLSALVGDEIAVRYSMYTVSQKSSHLSVTLSNLNLVPC